jgi:hypothetical protein
MKHIKKYNEGLNKSKTNEIKEFCEDCLVYLIDDEFKITVSEVGFDGRNSIWLSKPTETYQPFNWTDIKEYYIPFLKLLDRNYSVVGFNTLKKQVKVRIPNEGLPTFTMDFDYLVDDKLDKDFMLISIAIIVE